MKTRSKTKAALEEAQARLWPVPADFPGPALEAVLAALPRSAKRCLRATCTAARAAVGARLTSLNATKDQALLPAAAPRLVRLQSVKCSVTGPGKVALLLAALPLLPAALTRLELYIYDESLQQDQIDALIAAIVARGSLESLDLSVSYRYATTAALLALGARLPALTEFRLAGECLMFRVALPVLELPWHQLQKLCLSFGNPVEALLPQLLAREAPALRSLELDFNHTLDVRALRSAPWFAQLTRLELNSFIRVADLLAGAPAQLALQELRVCASGGDLPLAAARRLAATAMPLQRLELFHADAGVVEAIAGAPWASSLQALQLCATADFKAPAAAGAAAAALAAAPLGALTSLEVTNIALDPDVAPLSRLLAAPWAPGLRRMVLDAYSSNAASAAAAVSALAAAPLPKLRVLGMHRLCLDAATLSGALTAAPWLQRLEQLTLEDNTLSLKALEALAAADMPSLCELEVTSRGLGALALQALAAAPWLPQLQRLRLGGGLPVAVFDACLDALSPARSPFRALAARGAEVDTSGLFRRH